VRRVAYERALAAARAQLGAPVFDSLWAEGRRTSPEQIVNTFAEPVSAPAPHDPGMVRKLDVDTPSVTASGLTKREIEVLRLVAQGLTDAQVAETLVISVRTVHWHLHAVYGKFGVTSRMAATRFAQEHALL
jgi:DNA-binding NarL/FixJ family response regulator